MDVKTFATMLARELTKRGISRELAVKHAVSLVRTFDEDDLREISSYTTAEEFSELTDSLAELINDREEKKAADTVAAVPVPAIQKEDPSSAATGEFRPISQKPAGSCADATVEIPVQGAVPATDGLENMKTKAFQVERGELSPDKTQQFSGIKTSDISIKTDTASEITVVNIPAIDPYEEETEIYLDDEDEVEDEEGAVVLTSRGKAFFWGITVVSSPFVLLAALLVLGIFALGIAVVCAFIVAALALVCCEAVAGSGLTLVGVIYGAIEIVSGNTGIGIYEIGLGICCGGLALCLGILTYNFAVLVLPYALKQLIAFEGYCLKRVGPMVRRFREECNRL